MPNNTKRFFGPNTFACRFSAGCSPSRAPRGQQHMWWPLLRRWQEPDPAEGFGAPTVTWAKKAPQGGASNRSRARTRALGPLGPGMIRVPHRGVVLREVSASLNRVFLNVVKLQFEVKYQQSLCCILCFMVQFASALFCLVRSYCDVCMSSSLSFEGSLEET